MIPGARAVLALLPLLILLQPCAAAELEELTLLDEHVIDGVPAGNLSGLERCGDSLWTVSDREDDRLYRLIPQAGGEPWQVEVETFVAPPAPDVGLSAGLRSSAWVLGKMRGGELDFEGLACDTAGNRYLVSESQAAVLQIPLAAPPSWLPLPPALVRQARASGMLQQYNSLFEGIVINPEGDRLWLAAEREKRGLLALRKRKSGAWVCSDGCVLMSEGGREDTPKGDSMPRDFSGLSLFDGKLYTLERATYRICRRSLKHGDAERCWSFAREGLTEARDYGKTWGMAEGLVVDANGAWIMLDNGKHARGDGEDRPILWRFAAPARGWGANP
ncbi:esterase-like activity of phytase family protein [Pseudomonas sp. UBA6310]|uniref:esterase-like activity of phytase family protein n=1 Tax=Pseudomonas sp. UBA6310 TaxID=1947327 RepID=UPI00257D768F|nr:esterase-like activity of phytase family protein [Pseudomonas sp. UBA6310]